MLVKDICIEAGIVAEGSINGVLDGKHYNRAVRVHKYIYEALMRLACRVSSTGGVQGEASPQTLNLPPPPPQSNS